MLQFESGKVKKKEGKLSAAYLRNITTFIYRYIFSALY